MSAREREPAAAAGRYRGVVTDLRSRARRAAVPFALVMGTAGILAYRALSARDDGDATVATEPARASAAASATTAPRPAAPVALRGSAASSAAASSSAAPAAGPPPSPLCASILAHNTAILPDGGASPLAPELGGGCFATPNGAWAVRIDAWKRPGEDWRRVEELAGSWTLVHVDRAGHEVAARPGAAQVYALAEGGDVARIHAIATFDYDGDGEPELLVSTFQREYEGAALSAAVVATFSHDAVTELAGLPKAYEGFDDVDHDGRPDVLWFPYGYLRAGALGDVREAGPSFVAHALAGGAFSLDDAVARAHVEAQCPRANADAGDAAHAELCALLRGATRDQARAVLEKECKRPDIDAGDTPDGARPGVCFDFDERAAALDVPPPLHLAP